MSGCEDCRQEPIDPLIGREAWRQARLTDATGPTGPTGVVHDMRSATGSFDALVESNLCACGVPGIVVTAVWGFTTSGTNFISNAKNFPYRDGVLTVTSLAAPDLANGVWIKAEIVPQLSLPVDDVARGPLPFALGSIQAFATPNFVESSKYIYEEHGMRFGIPRPGVLDEALNYQTKQAGDFFGIEYYSGPVRITAGYGTTIVHDVYSVSPGIFLPSVRVASTPITLAISPHHVEMSDVPRRISAIAQVGPGGVYAGRRVFSFPIELPDDFILGGGEEHKSTLALHNGITLDYDPSRMNGQPLVNQQLLRGPTIDVVNRPILKDGKTDVIVPAGATAPAGQVLPVTEASVHIGQGFLFGGPDYISRNANEYQNPLNYRFFARGFGNALLGNRPDLHEFPACYALNGPTWHERNVIRYGRSLAVDGARHKLKIKFDWNPPDPSSYVSFTNVLYLVPPTWELQAQFDFLWLGGLEVDMLPVVQGRNLMPGEYLAGATSTDPISISTADGDRFSFIDNEFLTESGTASVDMEIERIVHSYGSSVVLDIAPEESAPPAYTALPLPGQEGMTLDGYAMWLPTLTLPASSGWPQARPIAGARISVRVQAWLKISVKSVDLDPPWSGNRVVYRKLDTPEIFFDLSDEECNSLSDGEEISVSSVALLSTNSRVDPYKIQFSIYEPEDD